MFEHPLSKPQFDFLSCNADWALYGGSAGSGKTFALTVDPLRHTQGKFANPKFRGAIFRRTYPTLTKSGGLLDGCLEMYGSLGAKHNHTRSEFLFPCGSKIGLFTCQFAKDLENYKGAQFDWLGFDEISDFPLSYILFLWSRCRSSSGVKPVLRFTANPDRDSWLFPWVSPWLDLKTGLPNRELSGVIKHFKYTGQNIQWFDEPQYAVSPETGMSECITTSGTFVPGSLADNPHIDIKYRQRLEGLDEQEKQRFLYGNWNASSNVDTEWDRTCFNDIYVDLDEFPSPENPAFANTPIVRMFAVDASKGKKEKEGDYSSICCVAQSTQSDIKYVDADLARRPPGQIVSDLFLFCDQPHHRIISGDLIGIETLQFQELFLDMIYRYAADNPAYALSKYLSSGNIIIPVKDTLPKPLRIRRLDPFIKGHRLRYLNNPGTSLLVQQLRNFNGIQEKGKHDDGPDSLDMATQLPRHLEIYWEERRKGK